MATIVKRILSGSTDGQPITISATTYDAKTIHAVSTSTAVIDEVWLYAANSSTNAVTITTVLNNGNSASTSCNSHYEVQPKDGLQLIMPGLCFQGNSLSNTISIGASTSNVITVLGFVNRITQ